MKIGRTYQRIKNQAWFDFCSLIMIRFPRLYAWFAPYLSKGEGTGVSNIVEIRSRLDYRQSGLQSQPRDWDGYIIAAVVVVIIVTALAIGRPNPFQ